jgi:two-component system chemotaxis response regulator CheB
MKSKITVLVVDDSAVARKTIEEVLNRDPDITVMAAARDPYHAAELMRTSVPDVIMLDVEMPRMDGITFLQKLMAQRPIPVVICSSLTGKGCETTLKALEYGAVDIITKPRLGAKRFLEESRIRICDAVKAASRVKVSRISPKRINAAPKLTADAVLPKPSLSSLPETTEKVVVVGASTGGTEALRVMLETLPRDAPGMVIVQHMPEKFTDALAKRLDGLCSIGVKEARDGDRVMRGQALIAPGNRHTLLKRSGAVYYVQVKDGPLVCRHRPSVDVLFRSAARYAGPNAVGVIMTGMGDDGARGMIEMSQAGAYNIAQDEASCVVYGMPAEAVKRGAVNKVVPLDAISGELIRHCQRCT